MEEIKEFANECLNCPIKTNIPEFISCIKEDNLEEAYKILMDNNIFSHICATICPQHEQCEGACIRQNLGSPTKIGKLEKFVNEWAKENSIKFEKSKKEDNGKKAAIIGSGPASLECAYELLLDGFKVDIFEKESFAGGLLSYGIPDFRLNKELVEEVINRLIALGANFIFEKELGVDFHIEDLSKEYDAVFVGIGAGRSLAFSISDSNTGVIDANILIKDYYKKDKSYNLGKAVIIGGGNVAMDCSRIALKMGATSSTILYRRDKNHMPANPVELEEAILDGVTFKELTRVVNSNEENGKLISLNCVKTEIVDGKAKDIEPKEEFIVEADSVIYAIGMKPFKDLIESEGLKTDEYGYILIDENGKTNLENVYAGGDVVAYKYSVARAIASGKKAAMGIINK